ncbi:MAG: group II intron reverse transcriptase domain-containing protein [Firmicutes bacterium]|nr:group II intron reverse transcriptase domain-containing protein [Bacillota bacterium]
MGKGFDHLYPAVYELENLYHAYVRARRNKRYYHEILTFSAALEENLIQIQNELIYRTYRSGRHRQFYIYEPKKRLIMAPPFRDRIVHHALCNVIEPILDQRFIFDSYACRAGKGMHRGVDRLTHFLRSARERWGEVYCLKADIAQYFPSIDHEILLKILWDRIKCEGTRWLIAEIVRSTEDPREYRHVGLPIGNLTSQLFANVYMDQLDQFVKHHLRAHFYIRYMDDFIILEGDKQALWHYLMEIKGFLEDRLCLHLNRKTSIFPVWQGIDFLGYRIWDDHRLLRKANVKRAKRMFKRLSKDYSEGRVSVERVRASVMSWIGHCKHADTYHVRRRVLAGLHLQRGKNMGKKLVDNVRHDVYNKDVGGGDKEVQDETNNLHNPQNWQ